ncbi:hypothetical protein C4D60_Mb02t07050 [Musa balbisiana]|uniref:Uncharacterized protein n=1 Tax=Musa balbisiana TaxID=52838 RepID=A0A4V4H2H8_MUSBA|nr:hypothetical protein C4D60_Mb02t07050 [Musa balbisiana]
MGHLAPSCGKAQWVPPRYHDRPRWLVHMHLELPKIPVKVQVVLEDVQLPGICQHITPSSLPGRKDFLMIPDLNDPLSDC